MVTTKILGVGIFFIILGLSAIGSNSLGYTTDPRIGMAGIFMAGAGIIFMLFGIMSLVGMTATRKKGIHSNDAAVFTTALFRCMLAISIADNHLDESEIAEISKIYKHLTKADLDEQVIRDTAEDMIEHGFSITDEINIIKGTLNKVLKEKLIIASLYILAADGEMDEGELLMLNDIREGLGFSINHVEKMKENFLKNKNLK